MARGLHAADRRDRLTLAPGVEFFDLVASLKAVVTHHHQAIGQVELVRVTPAIGVDLMPVSRLELMERVPERAIYSRKIFEDFRGNFSVTVKGSLTPVTQAFRIQTNLFWNATADPDEA